MGMLGQFVQPGCTFLVGSGQAQHEYAHLERSLDRTPNQLKRLQRLRGGQPVAPRIDGNVSESA
jgi:hypothetical protein